MWLRNFPRCTPCVSYHVQCVYRGRGQFLGQCSHLKRRWWWSVLGSSSLMVFCKFAFCYSQWVFLKRKTEKGTPKLYDKTLEHMEENKVFGSSAACCFWIESVILVPGSSQSAKNITPTNTIYRDIPPMFPCFEGPNGGSMYCTSHVHMHSIALRSHTT